MSAHVLVELDTTPPAVGIVGSGHVSPPTDVTFTVTSSEEIGWLDLSFTDATGERHDVGSRRLDAYSVYVTIPSTLVPRGTATFRAAVADTVSNVTVSTQTVLIEGVKPFDVALSLGHGLEVDEGIYHGYGVELTVSRTGVLASPPFPRALAETITGLIDVVTSRMVAPRAITEVVGAATDLLQYRASHQMRSATDAAPVTEQVGRQVLYGFEWPDETNTGVPPEQTLEEATNYVFTTPGEVVTNKEFIGCVDVSAVDVVFRYCLFHGCAGTAMGHVGYAGLNTLFEDCEFDGENLSDNTTAVGYSGWTMRRCNVHHVRSGVHMNDGVLVEYSYIHDLYETPFSHNESVLTNGGAHFILRHNNLECDLTQTACISLFGDFEPVFDALIQHNLLNGGGYALYGGSTPGKTFLYGASVRVIDNHFGRKFNPECGTFGPVRDFNPHLPGNEWSGNVWDDGAAATNSHQNGDPVEYPEVDPPIETTSPTVTINQAQGQAETTSELPIRFAVVFSERVDWDGTVNYGGTGVVTGDSVSGEGRYWTVSVTAVQNTGTVIPTIPAGVATDMFENPNVASTSTDNQVTHISPTVVPTTLDPDVLALAPATWARAEDAAETEGDGVSLWPDRSGHDRDLSQPTEARQPILRAWVEGDPAVEFVLADSHWVDSGPWDVPEAITTEFFVVRWHSGAGGYLVDGAGNTHAVYKDGGQISIYAGSSINGDFPVTDALMRITAIFNGASSSVQVNDAPADTGNAGAGERARVRLGHYGGADTGFGFDGYLYEAIIFDRLLDSGETATVVDYLATKYGVS